MCTQYQHFESVSNLPCSHIIWIHSVTSSWPQWIFFNCDYFLKAKWASSAHHVNAVRLSKSTSSVTYDRFALSLSLWIQCIILLPQCEKGGVYTLPAVHFPRYVAFSRKKDDFWSFWTRKRHWSTLHLKSLNAVKCPIHGRLESVCGGRYFSRSVTKVNTEALDLTRPDANDLAIK